MQTSPTSLRLPPSPASAPGLAVETQLGRNSWEFGIGNLELGIWDLGFGIWSLCLFCCLLKIDFAYSSCGVTIRNKRNKA